MNDVGALVKKADYDRLIKIFGVTPLDRNIIKEMPSTHKLIEMGFIFAHRDFDKILKEWKEGKEFAILTGRGPSMDMHLGHLLIFDFVSWLQKTFNVMTYIPLSDDEKYVFRKVKSLEEAEFYAYDNAFDIMAAGFKLGKTKFFISSRMLDVYNLALKFSRNVTLNEIKAIFGFEDSHNPGMYFYAVVQAAHILYPTFRDGVRSLVPIAIDQDPYMRLSRDLAERLHWPKPAALHSKYLPGLTGEPMSASKPETAIFLTDDPKTIKKKIWNALTGGRPTLEEQRKLGGEPEKCVVFKWLEAFVLTPKEAEEWKARCKSGELLCGECKKKLYEELKKMLKEHHERKIRLLDKAEKIFLHDVNNCIIEKIREREEKLLEKYA